MRRVLKSVNDQLESRLGIRIKRVPANAKQSQKNSEIKWPKAPKWVNDTSVESDIFREKNLENPAFIYSCGRSGSTLLSSILNAHSKIYSPPETQFSTLFVDTNGKDPAIRAMKGIGLSRNLAKYVLWDTILSRLLKKSGKEIIVEKTPRTVINWKDIENYWPNAKIVFLLRHPVSIIQSWQKTKGWDAERAEAFFWRHANAIEEARASSNLDSVTVKYEDVTGNSEKTMKKLCKFLGVKYEPEMLNYGDHEDNGPDRYSLIGDGSKKIKSGKIQQARSLPEEKDIPESLKEICKSWGY